MEQIKQDLSSYLSSVTAWKKEKIAPLLEIPKKKEWGLLSLPIFSLTSDFKSEAPQLVDKLNKTPAPFIEKVSCASGFINFHFKNIYLMEQLNLLFQSHVFTTKKKVNQTIVIDYSSPNVAKLMNVGHLRATVIGQSIVNIAKQMGYKVVKVNHLGDWGTQFGKLIVAYKKWGQEPLTLSSLVDLYVRFHKEVETNKELEAEARMAFKKMEEGDKEYSKLWAYFVDISLNNYQKIWKKLKVEHDVTKGESFYQKDVIQIEKELKEKNILKESQGALVVFVGEDKPPCLIRKSDGASTYASRDLASISWRFKELKADLNLYVAGVDHQLHFQQLKQVLAQWNQDWNQKTKYLSFGMYRFSGEGRLSTRKGKTISLSELIDQSVQRVLNIIKEKNPQLSNKEKVSEEVGIGALIFNDLMNDRTKDVDFSWDKILNFDGDSGPFVQYCHVRCASLLKKASSSSLEPSFSSEYLTYIKEPEMIWIYKLLEFETRVQRAFEQLKPHILAIYLLELCHVFSHFYGIYPILNSKESALRLELVKATKKMIKQGLYLLNIEAPSSM